LLCGWERRGAVVAAAHRRRVSRHGTTSASGVHLWRCVPHAIRIATTGIAIGSPDIAASAGTSRRRAVHVAAATSAAGPCYGVRAERQKTGLAGDETARRWVAHKCTVGRSSNSQVATSYSNDRKQQGLAGHETRRWQSEHSSNSKSHTQRRKTETSETSREPLQRGRFCSTKTQKHSSSLYTRATVEAPPPPPHPTRSQRN
jgi:hypothetical protein